MAPSASDWEKERLNISKKPPITENPTPLPEKHHQTQEAPKEDTKDLSYADAVLAGLPPDDYTLELANLAKSAGQSLQDVIDFSHEAEAQSAGKFVYKDPYSGKMTILEDDEEIEAMHESRNLYGDLAAWCDSSKLEQMLYEAKEFRESGGSTRMWKRRKKAERSRKHENK